eukprot:CAMPEP_0113527630 /NCGR_PEP_ID=MMETSP0015_2-20120614/1398_1 /TAXON_ID=2838 /ORGANISM="Odontella" /LENGTH=300 /DNA_ID=CAMNT_0000426077 /DNA_START=114 /DNA_END=1016 /DNA_ORIENTATION=+ /assembly_acc=CAM_ASM_000160
MGLTALVTAVASSALLYVGTPRIPTYHVHSPTLSSVCPRSLLGGKLSATLRAGLEVTNENFMGADVHSASFDIFYEDWSGTLRHIGRMRDSHAAEREAEAGSAAIKEAAAAAGGGMFASPADETENRGGGRDVAAAPKPSPASASPAETPLFAVPARDTSSSHSDLVTIKLHSVPLSLTLKMLWDLISSFGKVSMLTSGVLHVKQPALSLPLTVGIVCDNIVNLMELPWRISGKDCTVKGAGPGWGKDIAHSGGKLKDWVLKSHRDTGKVLDRRREDNGEKERIGEWVDDAEHLVEWHAF